MCKEISLKKILIRKK